MIHVDYEELAPNYDRCRALTADNARQWTDLLVGQLGLDAGARVLDVGCGTGLFAALLAGAAGCHVVGFDPSPAMLAGARRKRVERSRWVQARAEALPFAAGTFDACLASHVIHHFSDRSRALAEMYRVLRPGGRLAVRFSTHAQLRNFIDYRFFPSALDIDLARSPDGPEVRELLARAGFAVREERTVRQPLSASAPHYLQQLRLRYSSVLTLIPEADYQRGLAAAADHLQQGQINPEELYGDLTLLVAVKESPPRGPEGYRWTVRATQPPVAVPAVSGYNAGGKIPNPRHDQLPR